jgi:hypothetical protein
LEKFDICQSGGKRPDWKAQRHRIQPSETLEGEPGFRAAEIMFPIPDFSDRVLLYPPQFQFEISIMGQCPTLFGGNFPDPMLIGFMVSPARIPVAAKNMGMRG